MWGNQWVTHGQLRGPFRSFLPPEASHSAQRWCCFVGVLTETHIWRRYWHLKYFRLQETAVLGWPCLPPLVPDDFQALLVVRALKSSPRDERWKERRRRFSDVWTLTNFGPGQHYSPPHLHKWTEKTGQLLCAEPSEWIHKNRHNTVAEALHILASFYKHYETQLLKLGAT